MSETMADAFRVDVEHARIVIEFGQVAAGSSRVEVAERVSLSLETARRLLATLDERLQPHAARLRAQQAQALAPAAAAAATRPDAVPGRPPPDRSGDAAALLLRLVGELGVPHQYERSLRMGAGGLRANRFLLTLDAGDIAPDVTGKALAICGRMGMPASLRDAARPAFATARCVHFGFEGSADSIVCKLYLERTVATADMPPPGAAVPLHTAFKWDQIRGDSVASRYLWFPGLTAAEIASRIEGALGAGQDVPREIAGAVLDLAASRFEATRLQYLEVEEPTTERRSFDLNLYNARLAVRDIQRPLARMREHFDIRPGAFQALYDQVKGMALGHLAGGLHRDGRAFFNVYYGATGLPHFPDRLG